MKEYISVLEKYRKLGKVIFLRMVYYVQDFFPQLTRIFMAVMGSSWFMSP